LPDKLQPLMLFYHPIRTFLLTRQHPLVLWQRLAFAAPSGLSHVSSGVKSDAKDPGFDVVDLRYFVSVPPTLQKRLLQRVSRIIQIADEVKERSQ
jgi:hypothetical protein